MADLLNQIWFTKRRANALIDVIESSRFHWSGTLLRNDVISHFFYLVPCRRRRSPWWRASWRPRRRRRLEFRDTAIPANRSNGRNKCWYPCRPGRHLNHEQKHDDDKVSTRIVIIQGIRTANEISPFNSEKKKMGRRVQVVGDASRSRPYPTGQVFSDDDFTVKVSSTYQRERVGNVASRRCLNPFILTHFTMIIPLAFFSSSDIGEWKKNITTRNKST